MKLTKFSLNKDTFEGRTFETSMIIELKEIGFRCLNQEIGKQILASTFSFNGFNTLETINTYIIHWNQYQ